MQTRERQNHRNVSTAIVEEGPSVFAVYLLC